MPVDLAHQRLKNVFACAVVRVELQSIPCAFVGNGLGHCNGLAHAQGGQLDFAGALQCPKHRKSLGQGMTPSQKTVIAQDDGLFVADAAQQARRFVGVDGDALEVVVGHHVVQLGAVKIRLL